MLKSSRVSFEVFKKEATILFKDSILSSTTLAGSTMPSQTPTPPSTKEEKRSYHWDRAAQEPNINTTINRRRGKKLL